MKRIITLLSIVSINLAIALACFWDYDTIEMERQQFPSVIELISGKFLRHSPEFHYWRIKDREKKLEKYPDSLSLYDDLAVSWSKIGDDKKAIEIILQKEKLQPGLYETYANLGTFYLHNRQLKKGIEYIDKAIKINPNAHFGREIYQKYLAEYVLRKLKNGKLKLPLDTIFAKHAPHFAINNNSDNFYVFLLNKFNMKNKNKELELPREELEKAIIGIMGMMKFGNYNSPILLEVLGDLLMNKGGTESARHLACRCYIKAADEVDNLEIASEYWKKAFFISNTQMIKGKEVSIDDIEILLKQEIKEGNIFFQQIKYDEISWINSGKNPEKEFEKKYYKEPLLSKVKHKRFNKSQQIAGKEKDSTLTNIIDYRPVLKHKLLLSHSEMLHIDSMYERSLVKEVKLSVRPVEHEVEESGSQWYIWGIVLVIMVLATFSGIKIWKKVNKK